MSCCRPVRNRNKVAPWPAEVSEAGIFRQMNCFHGINVVSPASKRPALFHHGADCSEGLVSFADLNGFEICGSSSTLSFYSQWEAAYTKKQKERAAKWMKLSRNGSFVRGNALKILIRKGVPNDLRGKVWMDMSGASQKMASNIGMYENFLNSAEVVSDPASLSLIELDLHRTFPNHPRFNSMCGAGSTDTIPEGKAHVSSSPVETPHIQSLRRVLRAYTARNKIVGYCQGMNFIVGMMLLFLNEESSFWLLSTLLEDILPTDYYAKNLIGCHVDLMALEELLPQAAPRAALVLSEVGLGVELLALEWMVGAFVRSLPSEAALRTWDCLFAEGGKVLFRTALALTRAAEPDLLAAIADCHGGKGRMEEAALAWMQGVGKGHIDAERLIKDAFALQLRRRDISLARDRCRARLLSHTPVRVGGDTAAEHEAH